MTSSHRGIDESSTAMNVLEMNAIGRMIALVTAGAASWLRIRPAMATPSAENASVPTRKATTSAGILAASMLEVVEGEPDADDEGEPGDGDDQPGADEAGEVDPRRQRRPPPPLHHPVLAAIGDHVGEVGERRRHDLEGGQGGDVELLDRPVPRRRLDRRVARRRR